MTSNYWDRATRRRLNRRRLLGGATVLGVGASALATVGCGDDDDDNGNGNGTPTSTGTAPGTATGTGTSTPSTGGPRRGGQLVLTRPNDFGIDPLANFSTPNANFASLVHAKLVRFAPSDPEVGLSYDPELLEGDLASDWEQADDLTFNFQLRDGVTFHDLAPVDGREVDAEDITTSFEAFMQSTNAGVGVFEPLVESVEATGDRTITIRTARPYAPFVPLLAFGQYWQIYPREIIESDNSLSDMPVGAGPFQLTDRVDGSYWDFAKHPGYWEMGEDGDPKPYVDSLRVAIIPEYGQQVAQFRGGTIHVLTGVHPDDVSIAEEAGGTLYQVIDRDAPNLGPQLRGNAPTTDVNVRRALSMALNREQLLEAMGGSGHVVHILGRPMAPFYIDPLSDGLGDAAQYFEHNPEEVAALISSTGVSDLGPYVYPNNASYFPAWNDLAELVVSQLESAGFSVQLEPVDYVTGYVDPDNGALWGNYDTVIQAQGNNYPDPSILYGNILGPSRLNTVGVDDPEILSRMEALEQAFEQDERKEISDEILQICADQLYYIGLPVPTYNNAVSDQITGYQVGGTYEQYSYARNAWLNA